jgi:hypothetical protein
MMTEKVFRYLLNEAAFVDRIVLSVWTDRKPVPDQLVDSKSIGILSRKSRYARRLSGKCPLTGNPVEVLYGKVSRFPRVPPCSVALRSETVPLTGSQVNETMRSLFPTATRIQPVLVELTFDFRKRNVFVGRLHQCLIHRARQTSEVTDLVGRRTIYIGSAASSWQVKIYDKVKRKRIVRLELTLRRALLRNIRIEQPDNITSLRSIELEKMFSLRRFSSPRIVAATNGWRDVYWQDMARNWEFDDRPLQMLCRMLNGKGDVTGRLFPRSALQRTVETMQKNLIW